ncbi:MAG: hypothetical protein LH660_09615 [Phormidesmis sp. CAN_BIN36]|nr:hypothetical protein [Phormidesmis sp. CAN_BIN36]
MPYKPQMKVLTMLFATILIACGKVDFMNLSRHSPFEKTYRRVFFRRFDFASFNQAVIQAAIGEDSAVIAVMDRSLIAKSSIQLIHCTITSCSTSKTISLTSNSVTAN